MTVKEKFTGYLDGYHSARGSALPRGACSGYSQVTSGYGPAAGHTNTTLPATSTGPL